MKKFLYVLFGAGLIILLHFVLQDLFPKSVGRLPVFAALFLFDLYLFLSYLPTIKKWKKSLSIVVSLLYWFPAILVVSIIITSFWYHFMEWDRAFRVMFVGIIFVGYMAKLVPIIFLFIADLLRLIRYISKPKSKQEVKSFGRKMPRSEFLKKSGLVVGGLMFSGLFWGMVKWVYDFKIWRETVNLPDLPPSFSGFRIVQFTDIHLGGWVLKHELEEAVEEMNSLNPDIIVFTGDLVNYRTDEAFEFTNILKKLKAKQGVYAILGNHDYGDYTKWPSKEAKEENMQQLYDFYEEVGWKLLRNENVHLKRGSDEIALLGVENWGSLKRFPKYGDLDKAIAGAEDIPVKILLSHDPTHWQHKVSQFQYTINLTLAGHTHGGQFGFEFPGMRWSPVQYAYKLWAGMYHKENSTTGDKQHLYVNRGIGTIGYPGRVGILPEITLIELQAKDA
ncbi:MAG: metallophosphoesterase [Bacteroidetes bacterium]|nr:MAG: metallophosphoesterase [Bacteroidota bacterium]